MAIVVNAIYEGGVLRLEGPVDLAERTRVRVTIEAGVARPAEDDDPSGWKAAEELIGCVKDAPSDMAANHDFYLYGHLRRKR